MATIDAHGYVIYCILCCFSPAVRVGVNVFHRDTYGIRRGVLVARSDELGNPRASVVERAADMVSTLFFCHGSLIANYFVDTGDLRLFNYVCQNSDLFFYLLVEKGTAVLLGRHSRCVFVLLFLPSVIVLYASL